MTAVGPEHLCPQKLYSHAVKVKGPGDKRWSFLTSGGGETHLRVHAATI